MNPFILPDADRSWMRDRTGKQHVLYMTRKDEDEFVRFLGSKGNVEFLPSTSSTSDFSPVRDLPETTEDEATRHFWIRNTSVRLPLVTEYDPSQGFYFIDEFQSPVAEFVRCFMTSRVILPGRIRAEPNYFDEMKQDLFPKPSEFREWFESIKSWIRSNYKHLEWLIYAGPDADRFRKEGGILH